MFVELKSFTGETCSLWGPHKPFLNCWCLLSTGRVALLLGSRCFLHLGSHHTQWGWQGTCGMWTMLHFYADFLFSFMCYFCGPFLKLALCPHVFTESMVSFKILQCVAGTDFFPFRFFLGLPALHLLCLVLPFSWIVLGSSKLFTTMVTNLLIWITFWHL